VLAIAILEIAILTKRLIIAMVVRGIYRKILHIYYICCNQLEINYNTCYIRESNQ